MHRNGIIIYLSIGVYTVKQFPYSRVKESIAIIRVITKPITRHSQNGLRSPETKCYKHPKYLSIKERDEATFCKRNLQSDDRRSLW